LDAIEKAIRNAFEKGDADDRAFREKVYRSAFAALDRALKANPNLTVETAINRRKAMQAKITEIESEFQPAVAAIDPDLDDVRPDRGGTAPTADAPQVAVDGPPGSVPRVEMPLRAEAGATQPLAGDSAVPVEPDRDQRRARRFRIPFTRIFVTATVLAAIGIGGWWAYQTGLLKSPAERDTSVRNPPATTQSEDFIPENEGAPIRPGQADPARNWITVFSPEDATKVTTPGDAKAEVMQDTSGSFLRIRSGQSGATVLFDIGQGVLEHVGGKTATFDIVARGEDGKETQMSVDCNFGELGDCGRKRYALGLEQGDYLFEIDFAKEKPGSGGTIAINSDVAGEGKAVDIYEIKVSVSQ